MNGRGRQKKGMKRSKETERKQRWMDESMERWMEVRKERGGKEEEKNEI